MKKKEVLVVFVLAVFLTGVNFFCHRIGRVFGWAAFPLPAIKWFLTDASCLITGSGLICPTIRPTPLFYLFTLTVDFLFWFLVLILGWLGLKKLGVIGKRKSLMFH